MQGEFRVGMYAKIIYVRDPNFNRVGYVRSIDDTNGDYDVLTLVWPDGTVSLYRDGGENFDILILLSRRYAIDWLSDIGHSDLDQLTNDELLEEICLSGCVHDELIDSVFDDTTFKIRNENYST